MRQWNKLAEALDQRRFLWCVIKAIICPYTITTAPCVQPVQGQCNLIVPTLLFDREFNRQCAWCKIRSRYVDNTYRQQTKKIRVFCSVQGAIKFCNNVKINITIHDKNTIINLKITSLLELVHFNNFNNFEVESFIGI